MTGAFFKHMYLICFCAVSVLASIDFDYLSIKPTYNAGDFMELNVINTPEANLVGDPTITLILFDEFGKLKLQTIFGPKPLTDLPRRKPYLAHYWEIPTEINSEYEAGTLYRIKMIYSQAQKGSNEVVTATKEHRVTIRGLKAVPGDKPNPLYNGKHIPQPQEQQESSRPYPPPVQQSETESDVTVEPIHLSDGATWAYSMVKTLLVHLLI
ncbi:hypothetical protein K7432_013335 [Basidiobolus ranarum]|uniref:Uncharacterized protein n=1 Tax=Basidiobolus ranarum TaxID=34480 RepID=A0ABR2VRL2_9FUNG